MKTLDQKINELKPGQSIEISRVGENFVTVERSGNGKKLNFVRHNKNGWQVFKTSSF